MYVRYSDPSFSMLLKSLAVASTTLDEGTCVYSFLRLRENFLLRDFYDDKLCYNRIPVCGLTFHSNTPTSLPSRTLLFERSSGSCPVGSRSISHSPLQPIPSRPFIASNKQSSDTTRRDGRETAFIHITVEFISADDDERPRKGHRWLFCGKVNLFSVFSSHPCSAFKI